MARSRRNRGGKGAAAKMAENIRKSGTKGNKSPTKSSTKNNTAATNRVGGAPGSNFD